VRLFGGGTAALKLTDPNDVLGSGIDIEVQITINCVLSA